jgi:glycolate oxidase FAD binding subunit
MNQFRLHNQLPSEVATPASAEELAELLGAASAAGRAVVPWGSCTRQHIGRPPQRYDIALSTAGLQRIIEHSPPDLVVTVEGGARLGDVQAELARHGQWLPWDPPCAEEATIGGLLASGASGPLRLGYGAPRDWTLGMRVAHGDGRLVKSGAKVVKNVAGYDAHKLHLGALGTLGVIVEATFKLAPLPEHSHTLLASFTQPLKLMQALELLAAPPLRPLAMVALNNTAARAISSLSDFMRDQPEHILLAARFSGVPAAVARQMREAARRCAELDARCIDLSQTDERPLWQAIANLSAPAHDGSVLVRAGIRPGEIVQLARCLEQVPRQQGWQAERLLLGGVGLGYARWHPPLGTPIATIGAALASQRAALSAYGGYSVVEEAPPDPALDIWGPPPPTIGLMRGMRAAWDPAGILNPGRYLV